MTATTDDNKDYRRRQGAAPQEAALVDRDDYRDDQWPEPPPALPDTAEDNGDWMGLPPSFDDPDYSAGEDLDDDQWHRAGTAPVADSTTDTIAEPLPTEPVEAPPSEHEPTPAATADATVRRRPAGLAAVAISLTGLLAFGAYALMREGSALQAEIQLLQAQLETAVLPADVLAERELRRTLLQRNESLENALASQQLEYTRLEAELGTYKAANAALERELLAARQEQAGPTDPTPAPPGTAGVTATTSQARAANAARGDWFVNFGSYGQRALAQRWIERLHVITGKVVLQEALADGKPIYRVRIIGLATRSRADDLARTLESEHEVPALWVGRE